MIGITQQQTSIAINVSVFTSLWCAPQAVFASVKNGGVLSKCLP